MAAAKKMTTNDKIVIPEDLEGENGSIFDIGPETIKKFSGIIRNAKTIIWGGPMGFFEKKGFEKGSYAIARAIASSNAFSIVGGGETTEIITALKLEKKISLLSTGGGAMLDFLAGKKLPALQALKKRNPKH
ncbi:MAG: phosphoglycerate kinase [Candidatus Colwellbacteria bacterium RIFCSPLOWO2_01_FULL_48_10]|uniref:phosphoglycerate kinase n=1 Tax=Candidatus Colwellbacteria bacterium RIFCSPLOWO2_01_FULL_48_10 TaxID=1797690 RepID=A0A1G1Z5H2_9BACT|nr:MAG: phosphoglycerate kinase [Candidatus Colwellbacteria bacterium RIFCSPLOWO2_01_FULL_48_10]